MAADASFVWLRPATEMENLMDCGNKKGLFVTVYGLTLSSSVPLSDSHIKETLHHIFRKVPVLRMCFRKRGDTLWACDMNRDHLDFQVTETQDLVPAVEALFQHHFPSTEGPLWCARLLPAGAPGRCSLPEVAAAFPHSRTLLLANHHGIADGITNMFISDAFLHLLDDVIAGGPIDDVAQLGRLVAGEETKAILTARMEEMMKDEGCFQQMLEDIRKSKQSKKLIPRAYPMSRDPNYKSQIVLRDLDKETTQSFIKKCKKEGVTVNSGLVAVFNASLVDFVREGGLEQDFYYIQEEHSINMRRYWSGDTSGTLGVHRMAMYNVVSTPAKWRDNFWDYARSIHKNFSQSLQRKDAVLSLMSIMNEVNAEDYYSERPMSDYDYGTSNMGNIDHLIPTEGKQVQLTHLVTVTSCWNEQICHMFQTLRGCFMYNFIYANDILTREKAQKLVDKIFENLKEVTTM